VGNVAPDFAEQVFLDLEVDEGVLVCGGRVSRDQLAGGGVGPVVADKIMARLQFHDQLRVRDLSERQLNSLSATGYACTGWLGVTFTSL
jgi:hypothetical protein